MIVPVVCVPSKIANSNFRPAIVLINNHKRASEIVLRIRCKNSLTSGSIEKKQSYSNKVHCYN